MSSKLELVAEVSYEISDLSMAAMVGSVVILGSCLPLCFVVALVATIPAALYILGVAAIILGSVAALSAITAGVSRAIYKVADKACKRKELLNSDLNQGNIKEEILEESVSNQGNNIQQKTLVESVSKQGRENYSFEMSEISGNKDTIVVRTR